MTVDRDRAPRPATTPEVDGEFDIPRLSRLAVDQVILDGLVDGEENRVHVSVLVKIAFPEVFAPEPVLQDFEGALSDDSRYLDTIRRKYGYTPEIEGDTEATVSPIAIVKGRGIYSEQERRELIKRMDSYIEIVYGAARVLKVSNLSLEEVSSSLEAAGIEPEAEEFSAFLSYMKRDSRQWLTRDGKLILATDAEGIAKMPPKSMDVEDFSPLITEALMCINTGEFSNRTLLTVIRKMGVHVYDDEIKTLFGQLGSHPDIVQVGEDSFGNAGHIRYKRRTRRD